MYVHKGKDKSYNSRIKNKSNKEARLYMYTIRSIKHTESAFVNIKIKVCN
jgi:hypothetical protein